MNYATIPACYANPMGSAEIPRPYSIMQHLLTLLNNEHLA